MTSDAAQARIEHRNQAATRARADYEQARAKALENGFTNRQAPFAAQAFLMAATVKAPTVREVRRHLEFTKPWLFEEAA